MAMGLKCSSVYLHMGIVTESLGLTRESIYTPNVHGGWRLSRPYPFIPIGHSEAFAKEELDYWQGGLLVSPLKGAPSHWRGPVFFQPSGVLKEEHKEVLKRGRGVDLGIDPYSLGLYRGDMGSPLDFSLLKDSLEFESLFSKQGGNDSWRGQSPGGDSEVRGGEEGPCQKRGDKGAGLVFHHVFRFSSLAYSLAGAQPHEQLGLLLASTNQLIQEAGDSLSPSEIQRFTSYDLSLGSHFFINITQIRSLELLLTLFYQSLGVEVLCPFSIYATPSPRYLSTREPHNNLIRLTGQAAAALCGGVRGFMPLAYDLFSKNLNSRWTTQILLILEKESSLPQWEDPVQGSGLAEDLQDQLCQRGWEFFQRIEDQGGLLSCLKKGWLQAQLIQSHDKEWSLYSKGKSSLIGVTDFVLDKALDSSHGFVGASDRKDVIQWWEEFCSQKPRVESLNLVPKLLLHQLSSFHESRL